jgi:hypothetical protein
MALHAITLRLRVSAKQYADAARQLRDGNVSANPLSLAFIEQGEYILSGYTNALVTLMDVETGQLYSASMPAVLTHYLAGFRRGPRVLEDHEFELALESEGD